MARQAQPGSEEEPDRDPSAVPLPDYRHLPGRNPRPTDDLLPSIARSAPTITEPADAAGNTAWRYGIRLMRHGFFWEAHEVLEPVWFNAAPNSRERYLVQGLIQLANAALKAELGQARAVRRLAEIAAGHLRDAGGETGLTIMDVPVQDALTLAETVAEHNASTREPGFFVQAFAKRLDMHYNA